MNDLGREEGKKTRGRGGKRGKEAVERGGGKEEGKQKESGEGVVGDGGGRKKWERRRKLHTGGFPL